MSDSIRFAGYYPHEKALALQQEAGPDLYEAAQQAFAFLGGVDGAADVRDRLLRALLKAEGKA